MAGLPARRLRTIERSFLDNEGGGGPKLPGPLFPRPANPPLAPDPVDGPWKCRRGRPPLKSSEP